MDAPSTKPEGLPRVQVKELEQMSDECSHDFRGDLFGVRRCRLCRVAEDAVPETIDTKFGDIDNTISLTNVPEDYAAGLRDTSQIAFHSTDRKSMRANVYRFFLERGNDGATADEVVVKFDPTGTLTTSYAPRVTELMREGLLSRTLVRRKTTKGRPAIVYVAATKANREDEGS